MQPWSVVSSYDHPDEGYDIFLDWFTSVLTKHGPEEKKYLRCLLHQIG